MAVSFTMFNAFKICVNAISLFPGVAPDKLFLGTWSGSVHVYRVSAETPDGMYTIGLPLHTADKVTLLITGLGRT
jgi:hypothetical protein